MRQAFSSGDFKRQLLNQLLNFSWTLLCFLPVLWYWAMKGPDPWFYGSMIVSIACSLLPVAFYKSVQISRSTEFYERYGVRIIRKFVQHGDLINKSFRQRSPGYKVIKDARRAGSYLKTIMMYERYHLMCFLFFLSTTFHSLFEKSFLFAGLIVFGNVIYNVCPIFLQQYNRLRIQKIYAIFSEPV